MIVLQRTDSGVQFVCTIVDEQSGLPLNLSGAADIYFIFKQPNESNYIVSGSLLNDGSDGKITYTSQSTDLQVAGIWQVQVAYTIGTYTKLTNSQSFIVEPNLTDL